MISKINKWLTVSCSVLFFFILGGFTFASTISPIRPTAIQPVVISNVPVGSFLTIYSPCDTITPYFQGTGPTSQVGQDFYFDPTVADFGCNEGDFWRSTREYRILIFPERLDDICSFAGQVQDAFNTICVSQASEQFNFNVFVPTPTLTTATGGSTISADNVDDVWTSLIGPIIFEGATADIRAGTIILEAPSGFIFDADGTAPTVLVTRTAGNGSKNRNINELDSGSTIDIDVTTTQLIIAIRSETRKGVTNSLTWQNIRVRPIIGTSLERGNITKTGTSVIVGVNYGTTSFGTLSEVAGVVISGLSNNLIPSKSKTWNWDSDNAKVTYRFAIDQNFKWTPTGEYSDVKTASQSFGDGTYYLHVEAKDAVGNKSPVTTVLAVLDNTAPTVAKLGQDSSDVKLNKKDNDLLFSEALSDSSKTAVQKALIAGADNTLTFAWLGDTLTIYASKAVTFANDAVVNVADIAGNTATLLIVDSKLSNDQTTPDNNTGVATADPTTPQVVITNPTQAVNIIISNGTTNPTIDVSSFIINGSGILPAINIISANINNVNLAIPASSTVTSADSAWNGVIAAPTVTTVVLPIVEGETTTLNSAIEVGFTGAKLSFDKAVRILFPGQAGKKAGYIRTGTMFTEITNICISPDDQTVIDTDLVGPKEDCITRFPAVLPQVLIGKFENPWFSYKLVS